MSRNVRRLLAICLPLLLYSNTIYVILLANPNATVGNVESRKAVVSLETAISLESLQKGLRSARSTTDTKGLPLPMVPFGNASRPGSVQDVIAEEPATGLWQQLQLATDQLFSAGGAPPEEDVSQAPRKRKRKKGKYLRYNICNGLSNQLLIHAAYIARAKQEGQIVQIPDYFIVNGVQTTDQNVIPDANNSIPFGFAFDRPAFRRRLQELGINAIFVSFNFSQPQVKCAGVGMVSWADPLVVRQVIEAFRPSRKIQQVIQLVDKGVRQRGVRHAQGVCVHHRDGPDWHDHCARWGTIPDDVYRGNCLGVPGRSFVESLEDRGLDTSRWVYYCGDHAVPPALPQAGYKVVTRTDILSAADHTAIHDLKPGQPIRDLWALVDFFTCRSFPQFIGNSVSTFSAIQIALRDGEAYWYNSQSIPLSDPWQIYQIPIVYTYTELSAKAGQHFLRASIASVRRQMPHNKIHVLYHGKKDEEFRTWLAGQNVTIHSHFPQWRQKIEEMRRNGDRAKSHLFQHSGNYMGTWQRIDIPLFLNTEYCLLLDADTIINNPFTLADFGLNMTYGIAMSSEMHLESTEPSNAGVTLMNIPLLRRTHKTFLKFILDHVDTAEFNHSSPSDQGAYLVFYQSETRFLKRSFNMKPYWPVTRVEFKKSNIVHFHGPKPHEYLKFIMGKECNKALGDLCLLATKRPALCHALRQFAVAIHEVGLQPYCQTSFANNTQQDICENFLAALANETIECVPKKRVTLDDLEGGSR